GLPPAGPDHPGPEPGGRRLRRLRRRGGRLRPAPLVCHRVLHPGRAGPGPAPAARGLERPADLGGQDLTGPGPGRVGGPVRGLPGRAAVRRVGSDVMSIGYTVGEPIADTKAPDGPIETRWERRRF